MKTLSALLMLTLLTVGCTVGPNYKRPSVDVPGGYRGAAPTAGRRTGCGPEPAERRPSLQPSLGDEKWWEVFQDPELQELIRTALKNNYDVQIAAARILKAQAQLGITRADQLPTLSVGAAAVNLRLSAKQVHSQHRDQRQCRWQPVSTGNWTSGANTVARPKPRGPTCWRHGGRGNMSISTLVSNVAASYFQLRALDLQLEISKRTLADRKESLKLTQTLANGGAGTMIDVRQAEQLVATAAENIPDLERRIEQQENYLSTLLGNNPGPIARGLPLTEQPHAPEVPAGLPSDLLERRPDIRQAEQQLIAANAQIGVAKAAYYPNISLTANAGFASSALTSLFTGPAGLWAFGGTLMQPIFSGGRIKSGVRYSEAQKQEMLLMYRQTIQQAFRGVSDSLVAYHKDREFREYQQQLTDAAQDAARLSEARYAGGRASYLEVLTNNT